MKKVISLIMSFIMIVMMFPNVSLAQTGTMKVVDMKTDHMTNPIGIDSEKPLFSWALDDDAVRGQVQKAYRICLAESSDKLNSGNYVWDSGKVLSDNTIDIEYGGSALKASTRYFWNVTVWDKNSVTSVSPTAYFETGLMNDGWSGAQWIGRSETRKDGYFEFTDFTLDIDLKIVNNAASVLFGTENENNAYMWQISKTASLGGGAYYRPHKCTDGKWKVLANIQVSPSSDYASDYVHMTVAVKGGTAVTTLGGTVIDTRSLGSFNMGYFGFRKPADEKAQFDNIVLKDGSGKVVYSEDFEDGTADGFTDVTVTNGYADLTANKTITPIRYGNTKPESAPMLRREFTTQSGKTVASAKLYATSVGIYVMYINGKETTDSYFNPGRTNYDDTLMYQTFDVTNLVKNGGNAIGAYLGHGWMDRALHNYGTTMYLYAKLLITYTDGSTDVVVTDNNWRFYRNGPIIDDDMFNGFKYDATIEAELDGWTEAGFDDSDWDNVSVAAANKVINNGSVPAIVAQNIPLTRNTITLSAIAVTEPEKGVYIYDFGQNIAGVAKVTATAPKGTKMTLRHSEILNRENMQGATGIAGTLYTGNLPRAEATDTYIFRGDKGEETFSPNMTYHGFRYMEITGLSAPLPLEKVKALLIMTDLEQTGTFESSNDMVNQLYSNSLWSARDNFMSIPTDCPQRGERAGWTGDAQIFARTGAYMMDVNAFYQKYSRDMRDSAKDNRIVMDVAPSLKAGGYQYGKPAQNRLEATNGWGDAIVIIPYQMYKQYGNKKILEENYELMCNWMDYLVDTSTDYVRDQSWTGDWLPVNETKTPIAVTDTAFCAYSASLIAEIAAILGKSADVTKYTNLYNNYRNAWQTNFLADDGCTTLCGTQTSYIVGLKFGLFDEDKVQGAAENLVKNIKKWEWHLTTGFLGLSYLNPVLSDAGYSDVAYKLLEQDSYPSWLYSVSTGATTIWETWDALRVFADGSSRVTAESYNHFSYGAVSEWMYRYMLGIERDDENSNSFRHFILKPEFGGSITYAKGSYNSPRGYIASGWELNKETGAFSYNATVPANTTATLYLPAADAKTLVSESGKPVAQADGVTFVGYSDGHMVYELESGSYSFAATVDSNMEAITSVNVINRQNINSTCTVDNRTYTTFPASVICAKNKVNITMVSNDSKYVFHHFEDVSGNIIANGGEVSGDVNVDAIFAYTGTDDGKAGNKTITVNGSSDVMISVNGTESYLPYSGEFAKGADVEIKVIKVPSGYEFAGLEGIACTDDGAYIMPKTDIATELNLATERYKKGYDIFFDFKNDLEGWLGENGKVEITHEPDYMHLKSVLKSNGLYGARTFYNLYGAEDTATGGKYLAADQYDTIEVVFRAREIVADSTPVLYISTESQPVYTEPVRSFNAKSAVTTAMADGQSHTITFDVSKWAKWDGNIKDIYIDVVGNTYADLMIDYIKIKRKAPKLTIVNTSTGEEIDYSCALGDVVDLTSFATGNGFLGYSLEEGSTDYITSITISGYVKVYANYEKPADIVWDFDDNTIMGWECINTRTVDTSGGSLKLYYTSTASKADVMVRLESQNIASDNYKYIVIEMRHNIPDSGFGSKPMEVFFKRSTDPKWNQSLSVNAVQLPASEGYKKYVLDLSKCSGWNGTVTSLRVDPFETTPAVDKGYWVEFDSIKLCNYVPQNNVIYSLDTYDELNSSWGNAVRSSVTGADGYSDTAVSAALSGTAANVFLFRDWDVSKFGTDKYVVYQADVKFGPNGNNFSIATKSNNPMSPSVAKTNPKLKQNDWNTITVVSEADGGNTKVYINGVYDCSGKSVMMRDEYDSSFTNIRFLTNAIDASDTSSEVVSYDNVLVYTTNSYPELYDEYIDAEYSVEDGVKYTAHTDKGMLIVASYKDNVLLDVKYITLSDSRHSVRMNTEDADYYIAYIWNDMVKITPLCNSKIYAVN